MRSDNKFNYLKFAGGVSMPGKRSGRGRPASIAPPRAAGTRRAADRPTTRPMLPAPHKQLAPLNSNTRALSTIYAPRKSKPRKNKTAQSRMLDDLPIKPTLSPFHPLPAIGQKVDEKKTKLFVFDLKDDRPVTRDRSMKIAEVLKPLTPLRIHGYTRKKSLDPLEKPQGQQLVRENTYDVIEPVYVNANRVKKMDRSRPKKEYSSSTESDGSLKLSPKTRFKNVALQVAKLSSMPETGKLLYLRERQTFERPHYEGDKTVRLDVLPRSPTQKLTKLTEIFQDLEMKGRHRDKMKKENSWF